MAGLGAAAPMDGASILNGGSTNAAGYLVLVRSDGQANLAPAPGSLRQAFGRRTFRLPDALARRLLADAREAKRTRPAGSPCMKSASFGSTTSVSYHGYTSPDLECPGSGVLARLASDVRAIVRSSGFVPAPGRRVGLPGGEPRRPEATLHPSPAPR